MVVEINRGACGGCLVSDPTTGNGGKKQRELLSVNTVVEYFVHHSRIKIIEYFKKKFYLV